MNVFVVFPLIAFFANSFLGVYVLYKNIEGKTNRIYTVFLFSLAAWSFSDVFMFISTNSASAVFWDKIGMVAVIISAASLVHFFMEFSGVGKKWEKTIIYLPAFVFFVINALTNLLTERPVMKYWGYAISPGVLYFSLSFYVVSYVLLSLFICYRHCKRVSAKERFYAKILMISIVFPLAAGAFSQVIAILFDISTIPLTTTFTTISAFIIAYAVFRRGLFSPGFKTIKSKIMISLLVASLIPFLLVGMFASASSVNKNAQVMAGLKNITDMSINYSTRLLELKGKEIIKEKAVSVSRELEIFVREHNMSIEELQKNKEARAIAVQKVGKTGYTAVHDFNAINRFHANPGIVGMDLHRLSKKLPEFWSIVEKSLKGDSWGYYNWTENGKTRRKYMYCRHIENISLVVCATTYMDEFLLPVQTLQEWIKTRENSVEEKIISAGFGVISFIALASFISLFVVMLISISLSKSISKPITELSNAIKVGKGNLDVRIPVKSKDEIGKLASAFKDMLNDLKIARRRMEEYTKSLEKKVQERTYELQKRVKELEDTKLAMLNMMEDVEYTNRELRKTQEKLKESLRELKVMDAKKDEFISIAAHELKTPLTAIHGFSQLLKNEKVLDDRKSVKKYMDIIDKETKRLANLVTNILELSRIDLGTIKFSREEIDLKAFMETLKKEMSVNAKKKGLSLKFFVDKNIGKIVSDREKLTQVAINLINNAIKYTEKGGIEVRLSGDEKNIHLMVKDTGIGIAEENIKKIFERFYQVDSSYTRKAGGTGLGLSLCKEYIEKMGGRIWAESELGKDSVFHVILPRVMPEYRGRKEKLKAKELIRQSEQVSRMAEKIGTKTTNL